VLYGQANRHAEAVARLGIDDQRRGRTVQDSQPLAHQTQAEAVTLVHLLRAGAGAVVAHREHELVAVTASGHLDPGAAGPLRHAVPDGVFDQRLQGERGQHAGARVGLDPVELGLGLERLGARRAKLLGAQALNELNRVQNAAEGAVDQQSEEVLPREDEQSVTLGIAVVSLEIPAQDKDAIVNLPIFPVRN